jgi:hypothetical protein
MRRALTAALAAALVAIPAGQAGSQAGGEGLRVEPNAVRVVTPAEEVADREPVYAARIGTRYRFEVAYEVGGAAQIGTGHVFIFENAVTGERLEVATQSFPPEEGGSYTESSELTIPSGWAPGVYRFRWRINARNTRLPSVSATGSHVFLVVGPSGPG